MFSKIDPAALTIQDIAKWNGEEMKYQLLQTGMREAVASVLQGKSRHDVEAAEATAAAGLVPVTEVLPVKTQEEIAAEEAAAAEAQRVADEVAAEAARLAAPKKFVIEYQVKDEDGSPIGRPTHLEATSQEDLIEKMKEAHIQATRAFHRLKKQKVTFKPETKAPEPVGLTDTELAQAVHELRSEDPKTVVAAQQKINKSEIDKQVAEERGKLAVEREDARKTGIVLSWLQSHLTDYNPCEANGNLIEGYLSDNNLDVTVDNLDLALTSLSSQLVPPVEKAEVIPVAPVPQAPVTAPAVVPPPVNPAPAAPKPGVNGGLVPGAQGGQRPAAPQPAGITIADIRSWDGKTMAAKMKNPSTRAEIERVIAAQNAKRGR